MIKAIMSSIFQSIMMLMQIKNYELQNVNGYKGNKNK